LPIDERRFALVLHLIAIQIVPQSACDRAGIRGRRAGEMGGRVESASLRIIDQHLILIFVGPLAQRCQERRVERLPNFERFDPQNAHAAIRVTSSPLVDLVPR